MAQRNDGRQNIQAGTFYPLWPDPTSKYVRLETPTGYAPGIAFCHEHTPSLGDTVLPDFGPVVGIDDAWDRYHDWYTDAKGAFWRVWLRDAMSLEPPQIDKLLEQWQADRG